MTNCLPRASLGRCHPGLSIFHVALDAAGNLGQELVWCPVHPTDSSFLTAPGPDQTSPPPVPFKATTWQLLQKQNPWKVPPHASHMLPPPGSVCLWKFKYWVKFIVSLSFILSIVLHFIMCGDILNGACHSISTAARGESHSLTLSPFRQPWLTVSEQAAPASPSPKKEHPLFTWSKTPEQQHPRSEVGGLPN